MCPRCTWQLQAQACSQACFKQRLFWRVQFCADVPPGNARAKECLEDNRDAPGFSPGCKAEVERMMEARAADFRLDPKLRQLCADDIQARGVGGQVPWGYVLGRAEQDPKLRQLCATTSRRAQTHARRRCPGRATRQPVAMTRTSALEEDMQGSASAKA